MTSSWFLCLGELQTIIHDGFWKSEHDFLISFHSNFFSWMHGFRDNEVLLPNGNDVIVISALWVVSHRFCWQDLKWHPSFLIMVHWHFSRISYCFGVIRHFILAGKCPFRPIYGVFHRKTPKSSEWHISHPQKGLPYTRPRLLSYCALKLVHGRRVWAVAVLKNKKQKTKNLTVTVPAYIAPTWRLDRSSDPNQIWQGW